MDVKALLLDIGGVLLTKGWGRDTRKLAAQHFGLDYDDMQERHALVFHIYEEGKITLSEYLKRVVFYRERDFTEAEFTEFIFAQSEPCPDTLGLIRELKARYSLKTVALSNEGREITEYRIRKFDLASLLDFFVCSCYVGTEKPDPAIYHFAMDQVQLHKEEVVYIDDTALHVEVARELDIPSIHHTDCESTRAELARMGLRL
jgi:putative hydrolase of the HAD superfamily